MNYELAKKLKDAGFPQTFPDGRWYYTENGELLYACEDHGSVHPTQTHGIVPTLSELIEACGEDFDKLQLEESRPSKWFAYGGEAMFLLSGIGSTPEESVANLWLALNKHE